MGPASRGNRQRTVVPEPGALSRLTSPPWARTRSRTIARPRPAPAASPERQKRSKARAAAASSIPLPVSATTSSTMSAAGRTVTVTRPPAGVWRSAFAKRLPTTCERGHRGGFHRQRDAAFPCLRLEARSHVGCQDRQVGRLAVEWQGARIGQGKGAQVLDHALQLPRLDEEPLEMDAIRRVEPVEHALDVAADHGERRAELMADVGQEPPAVLGFRG